MRCSSLAHAPRSISRQRSEQNGLKALAGVHLTRVWQVGQLIILGVSDIVAKVCCVVPRLALVTALETGR